MCNTFLYNTTYVLNRVFPFFFNFGNNGNITADIKVCTVYYPVTVVVKLTIFTLATLVSHCISLTSVLTTMIIIILSVVFCGRATSVLPRVVLSLAVNTVIVNGRGSGVVHLVGNARGGVGLKNGGRNWGGGFELEQLKGNLNGNYVRWPW